MATVVVVDDDPSVLSAIARSLRNEPYELLVTEDPYQAIRWATERHPALLITDEYMPAMRGNEVIAAARYQAPRTMLMLLTGYSTPVKSHVDVRERADLMLSKPWADSDLRDSIRSLIARRRMA